MGMGASVILLGGLVVVVGWLMPPAPEAQTVGLKWALFDYLMKEGSHERGILFEQLGMRLSLYVHEGNQLPEDTLFDLCGTPDLVRQDGEGRWMAWRYITAQNVTCFLDARVVNGMTTNTTTQLEAPRCNNATPIA